MQQPSSETVRGQAMQANPLANAPEAPLLSVVNAKRWFSVRRGVLSSFTQTEKPMVRAVDGVDLALMRGEVLGVIGESGSGKSTLAEMITRLQDPTAGSVLYKGKLVSELSGRDLKAFRKDVQVVFQDPYATLNPRYRIGRTLMEPLQIHGVKGRTDRWQKACQALERAGLSPADSYMKRWPTELSGGQRQRVAIARALVLEPKVLVADEPVSMLDVSMQAAILKLLEELKDTLGLSIIFISHDLSTVRYLCDRIAIMYMGVVVEIGPTEKIIEEAAHPYTRALLHAVPTVGETPPAKKEVAAGEPSSVIDIEPTECRFAPRCPYAQEECRVSEPELELIATNHLVRCVLPRLEPVWPAPSDAK